MPKTTVSIRLSDEVLTRLDDLAQADGKTRTQILESAIALYLGESPSDLTGRLSILEKEVSILQGKLKALSA